MKKAKIDDQAKQTTKEDVNPAANTQTDDTVNASQFAEQPATAQTPTEPTTAQPDPATAELLSDLQRTRADFENYRKQVESQKSLAMSAAKYATVEKFLPLIDDFERALTAYPEQLAPLRKNLDKTLATLSLSRIDSEPGTEFNPDLHEAVSVEDDDGETEIIAETLRPGYLYDGAVIRAAMVKVKHK